MNQKFVDNDETAEQRKQDHIELAFKSQISRNDLDKRFSYEPLLKGHPSKEQKCLSSTFLDKSIDFPLWISSMTGGTQYARTINYNLARVAKDFGFGMGLGSCRSLLSSDEHLADFNIRPILGEDLPLYANLGIAQLEQLIENKQTSKIIRLLDKLSANGLIIHVNPMQEWLQPEGDHFAKAPIETIQRILDEFPEMNIIVKEVGQGMGYESLKTLFQLPLQAIDFAANGGTNFARLELLRSNPLLQEAYGPLAQIGHSAEEMVILSNQIKQELGDKVRCHQVIISGGVKNFLDGYYLVGKSDFSAVYGQASAFLKYARADYKQLFEYVKIQTQGLEFAHNFLRIKK